MVVITNSIIFGVVVTTIMLGMVALISISYDQTITKEIQSDLNVLKTNDLAIGQYVVANSQALTFLNGCLQVADHNTSITLECKKGN